MAIFMQRYTVLCRLLGDADLPPYWGSALRGGFGWALKHRHCIFPNAACSSCLVRENCIYFFVFETQRQLPGPQNQNVRPHPYIIQPGPECNGPREKGSTFTFSLSLIGERALSVDKEILACLPVMGKNGLDRKLRRGRGEFKVQQIKYGHHELGKSARVDTESTQPPKCIALRPPGSRYCSSITIILKTPLCIKANNRIKRHVKFSDLVRAAMRRITSLEHFYGTETPDLDFQGLASRAEEVRLVREDQRWSDAMRYSRRQGQKTPISGIIGQLEVAGEVSEFLPLFEYTSNLNLGKRTVFGQGSFYVQVK